MIRWLLLLCGGALLGGVVHLATIMVLPRTATQDAYARLAADSAGQHGHSLPLPKPESATMPFMDPAFATAVCRYDLSKGSIKLTVPVSLAYTSISFYTRYDVAYYAINDRAAGRRIVELDLMTVEQRNQMPEDEDVTAADRLIVEIADRHRRDCDPGAGARAGPDADGPECDRRRALRPPQALAHRGTLISAERPGSVRATRSAPARCDSAQCRIAAD